MESKIFNSQWTFKNRPEYIERLKKEKFELIIVGGGVTAAGVAREAALRGIKTALIEKNDFAFGTSSRSSKLAHGGIRYLGNGEFGLVRESTTERNWLRNHFPNLVRPVAFNFCSYEDSPDTPLKIRAAVYLYDFLSDFMSEFKNYKKHRILTTEELVEDEPKVKTDGLKMCGQYYDTNVDDARLTLETIKESVVTGDLVALNYLNVDDYILDDGKIVGVKASDKLTGDSVEIHGDKVVNATGIWSDELLRNYPRKIIRPTKGVHIIIPNERLGNKSGFGLRSVDDGRFFFVIRREEFTVIGTTDTDYNEDLNKPWCTKEDCDYLFHTVNLMFPSAKLTYDDIISTYAGIRPLVREEGKSESQVSRKHIIIDTEDGLTTIAGGKLTIFRKMGEDVIFHLIKNNGHNNDHDHIQSIFNREFEKDMLKEGFSKQPFLIGLKREDWDKFIDEKKPNLPQDTLDHLYQQYGKGAFEIVENIILDPNLGERFIPENQFCPAEIKYVLKYEFAPKLIDVLCRRTEIQMKVKHTKQKEISEKVAKIMAEEYSWDEHKTQNEISEYLDYVSHTIWF